jgi:hypothetical protein
VFGKFCGRKFFEHQGSIRLQLLFHGHLPRRRSNIWVTFSGKKMISIKIYFSKYFAITKPFSSWDAREQNSILNQNKSKLYFYLPWCLLGFLKWKKYPGVTEIQPFWVFD